MRKVARIVLALQLAAVAVLLATQVAASAQSPAPTASTSPAPVASPSSASPTPAASAAASSAPPSTRPTPAPSTPGTSPTPATTEPPTGTGTLEVSAASTSLLVQLGRAVHYRVTVSNTGEAALHDVFVVDLLPREVTFVSAPLPNQVEAALYGKVGAQENITWNIGTLRPGQSVTLPWSGTAASLGDMTAVNAVRAEAAGAPRARRQDMTFVATSSAGRQANPVPTPTKTTVVTVRRIPTGTVLGSPDAAGETMPLTGFDPRVALLLGALFIGAGALAWHTGGPSSWRRRNVVLALTALALLAACTASRDEAAPRSTVSPQVKGKRIDQNGATGAGEETDGGNQERGEADSDGAEGAGGQGQNGPGSSSAPGSDASPSAPPQAVATPGTVVVRTARVVNIEPALRPPVALASRGGDNALTYTWEHDSGKIVSVSSSTAFGPPRPVMLQTSLRSSGGGTEVIAKIANTSRHQPLALDGRIRYELRSASGQLASLVSAPVRVTLNPGGSTSVTFTYDLPNGTYSAASSWESN